MEKRLILLSTLVISICACHPNEQQEAPQSDIELATMTEDSLYIPVETVGAIDTLVPLISLSENVVAIDSAGSVYITDRHNLTQDSTEIVWLSMVIDDTTINTSNENYPGSMVKEKIDQGMLPVLKHVKDRHWQVVFEFPSQNIPSTGDILLWVSPVESKLLDSLRANTPDYK